MPAGRRPDVTPGRAPAEDHVPRHVRSRGAGPDRGGHDRHRRDAQLRRARAALGPAGARAARGGPAAGRRGGAADREQPARLRGVLGRAAVRPVHHRRQLPPQAGRGRLHRQRQRRDRADRVGRAGRHRRGDHRPDRRAKLRLAYGGPVTGHGSYEETIAAASEVPFADQPHGATMLYSSGTTGRPKGVRPSLPDSQVSEPGEALAALAGQFFGVTRTRSTCRPARSPRGPAALVRRHPGPRRHRGHDEAIRRRAGPAGHRGPARHARAVRADDVRPHAAATAGTPRPLRRLQPAGRHPRRGAVPGRGQAEDDRLVGPGPGGVLRWHRGQRHDGHRQRHLAHQAGHRRPAHLGTVTDLRRRRDRTARGRDRRRLLRARRGPVRLPQRPGQDPRPRSTRPTRTGPPSATSATSTRTATCSSPTARRSRSSPAA